MIRRHYGLSGQRQAQHVGEYVPHSRLSRSADFGRIPGTAVGDVEGRRSVAPLNGTPVGVTLDTRESGGYAVPPSSWKPRGRAPWPAGSGCTPAWCQGCQRTYGPPGGQISGCTLPLVVLPYVPQWAGPLPL